MAEHQVHEGHEHEHGPGCGHQTIGHAGHRDFLHDGHMHFVQDDHVDEHTTAVDQKNRDQCTPKHACQGHDGGHEHGAACGHDAVPHGDHVDYVVSGHLHHRHGSHCDDHGPVDVK